MSKYLIEVGHSSDRVECLRAIQILLSTGNHYLTNSEWGCHDGVHKSWFIIEVENKNEAMMIIPPFYRKDTTITRLNRFKLEDVEGMLEDHKVREAAKTKY